MAGLLGAFKQYLRDAMPGGALNPEVTRQGLLDSAAFATMPVPLLGDVMGLAADANRYVNEPESRTPLNFGLSALGMLPLMPNMTVWHGSPHKFSKFDMSKVGTGEGAQAYGHGLYFAQRKGVAKSYADKLGGDTYNVFQPEKGNLIDYDIHGSIAAAQNAVIGKIKKKDLIEAVKDRYQYGEVDNTVPLNVYLDRIEELVKSGKINFNPQKQLYKVDLPDEAIAKMLDWDANAESQPEMIKKAAAALGLKYHANTTGAELITEAMLPGRVADKAEVSRRLKEAGIPGIRYLDGGSRNKGGGTYNFVVFDDQLPKILEVNGGLLGR